MIPTMGMVALQLGSRFALGPNQLGYCGRGSAPEKFKECISAGRCEGVEEEFSKFIVFYPYLRTLAQITGLDKYAYSVVEAYWLGNDELKKVRNEHYEGLLGHFEEQGIPDWLIRELREKKPKSFIPFHLFQILHVGVGRASSAVPFNLESINNCMIKWGRIVRVRGESKRARVKLHRLEKGLGGRYKLVEGEEEADYSEKLVPGLEKGKIVAVHWGMVAKKLTGKEVEDLSYWTEKVLETVEPVI